MPKHITKSLTESWTELKHKLCLKKNVFIKGRLRLPLDLKQEFGFTKEDSDYLQILQIES